MPPVPLPSCLGKTYVRCNAVLVSKRNGVQAMHALANLKSLGKYAHVPPQLPLISAFTGQVSVELRFLCDAAEGMSSYNSFTH